MTTSPNTPPIGGGPNPTGSGFPPLGDGDLDLIEARAAAATPGPWRWSEASVDGYRFAVVFGPPEPWSPPGVHGLIIVDVRPQPWRTNPNPDAAFIAAARSDVALLVAEVRRLHEAIAHEIQQKIMRHQAWLEVKSMLAASNSREQELLGIIQQMREAKS